MSKRWKDLEREAAEALGGRRMVRTSWFQSQPDVYVEDFPELQIDCKAYARFAHHGLMGAIAEKYCAPGDVPVLITKHQGQRGAYATVPVSYLADLLNRSRALARLDTLQQQDIGETKPVRLERVTA